jgi:hypothetical protein
MQAMEAINPRNYEHLRPFKIKDELVRFARTSAQNTVYAYRAAHQSGSTPAVPEPAWPKEVMQ